MVEQTEPREIRLNYVPSKEAYALEVSDVQMRIEVPDEEWSAFLDWLGGGWQRGSYGLVEVVWSPHMNANVLLVTVDQRNRGVCCLFALPPDDWETMIDNLRQTAEQLRPASVQTLQRYKAIGMGNEEIVPGSDRVKNPFALKAIWRGPL